MRVHGHRRCSAARALRGKGQMTAVGWHCWHRRGLGVACWNAPPLCRHRHRRGNPDASLFVLHGACAHAIGAAGPHAGSRHDGLPGNARRRACASHAAASRRSPRRSKSDPDHSGGRYAPARHTGRTHTSDAIRRAPPCTVFPDGNWTTPCKTRIKARRPCPCGDRMKKARGSVRNLSGPSLFGHPGQHSAAVALDS